MDISLLNHLLNYRLVEPIKDFNKIRLTILDILNDNK